jgi:hypothetical protein
MYSACHPGPGQLIRDPYSRELQPTFSILAEDPG